MIYQREGGVWGRLFVTEWDVPEASITGIGIVAQGDPVLGVMVPDDEIPELIKALKAHLASKPTRIHTDYDDAGKIKGVREAPV